jgi:hypothetical protein
MPSITLKAHYDGRSILLDEPFQLPANARLLVTLVEPATDAERTQWANLAGEGLVRAYGDDEPDYSPRDLRQS